MPTSTPRRSAPRPPALPDIQRRWSANDVAALEPLVGADLMVEWRRPPGGLRAQGLAQPLRARRRPSDRVRGARQPRGRGRGPRRRRGSRDARRLRRDARGTRSSTRTARPTDDDAARVVDAAAAGRAAGACSRSSRTPRAATTSTTRWSPCRGATRACGDEAAGGDRRRRRRARRRRGRRDRARLAWTPSPRRRAGPRAGRRPLRARRARGGRAARGRGVGWRPSTAPTTRCEALADRPAIDALLYGGDGRGRTRVVVRGARVRARWRSRRWTRGRSRRR